MNDHFNLAGARELRDEELMLVQGGGLLGDVWNTVTGAAKDVGHAIGSAATSTWNFLSSDSAISVYKAIGVALLKSILHPPSQPTSVP